MRTVAIYLILDDAESPRYIGRTFHPHRRPLDHIRNHPDWGRTYRVVEVVADGVRWQERERYWIAYYRRFAPLENIARGGGSAGPKSPDAIRRQREKITGRKMSDASIERMREAIRSRSPEKRAEIGRRISEAKRGRSPILTDAERQRRADAARGNKNMLGKQHSIESRRIIGEKSKGRAVNSGSFQKGVFRPKSEEWKRKRSLSQKGKKLSEETKQKIREKRALQDMSSRRKSRNVEAQQWLQI